MAYGSATPKRSKGWANHAALLLLDKGKLPKSVMQASTTRLAKTSVNAAGKKQWTGVRKALKDSQRKPQTSANVEISC